MPQRETVATGNPALPSAIGEITKPKLTARFPITDGRALADALATSILCRSAQYCSRLGWSDDTDSVTSPPDTDQDTLYASAPPLATS